MRLRITLLLIIAAAIATAAYFILPQDSDDERIPDEHAEPLRPEGG